MNREVHVRNCEGVGVKLPRATRLRNKVCFFYRLWLVRYYFFLASFHFCQAVFFVALLSGESRQGAPAEDEPLSARWSRASARFM